MAHLFGFTILVNPLDKSGSRQNQPNYCTKLHKVTRTQVASIMRIFHA